MMEMLSGIVSMTDLPVETRKSIKKYSLGTTDLPMLTKTSS